MHLPLPFWEATSTCMAKRQYLGTYSPGKNGMKYPSHPKLIGKGRGKGGVNKYIGNRNVVLRDYRPEWKQYSRRTIQQDLNRVGALKHSDMGKLHKMILRVFLNPNKKIQSYLKGFKQQNYGNDTQVFGVQIRLGGCLANYKESMALMTKQQFTSIPGRIKHHIHKLSNPVVYLSTDSDYAEKYIREHLPGITVLTSSQFFKRSHSTGSTNTSNVEAALVDLFLLSDSDMLLYQVGSGFGRIAATMTRARKKIGMQVSHYRVGRC